MALGQLIGAIVLLAPSVARASQGFADVALLAREGRLLEAHALAGSLADPLVSAQARLHVAWAGGDLVGALGEGERALERFPGDLYLLEQCSALALALGASERALEHATALDAGVRDAELSDDERRDWVERGGAAKSAAVELTELHGRRARSLALARATVLVAGLFALLLLLAPWRFLRRASRAR